MRKINLTNSIRKVIVDNKDYKLVSKHKWYLLHSKSKNYHQFYARSCGVKKIFLHRLILGLKNGDKRWVDHIDFNTLNNKRDNLRLCTTKQNNQHKRTYPHSSKYKGVSKVNHWAAHIQYNGKLIGLGIFKIEKDAAMAYNIAAKKYFKEFAVLNNV